jgi:hypothetical protein
MTGMDQNRLRAIMKRELEFSQLQLNSYCMNQLENLMRHGINRMTTAKVLDNAGYSLQAERNLRSLIEYFSSYSKSEGTFPQLSDSQFDIALRNCPTLWPFSASG